MVEDKRNGMLTQRQNEILTLVRRGLTNNEICKALNISANTVKVHLANIYKVLDVTNRTEAISFDPPEEITVSQENKHIIICVDKKDDFDQFSDANSLSEMLVESLLKYRLFKIQNDNPENACYQIKFSAIQRNCEMLQVSLVNTENSEIIWTSSQKISENSDIQVLAFQLTVQLFRQMCIYTASIKYHQGVKVPYWWYATCFSSVKMENRQKESYLVCEEKVKKAIAEDSFNDYVNYHLALIYYFEVLDAWVDSKAYVDKIAELSKKTMCEAPYSIYSKMTMTLYNILIGNKRDAETYLQQVLSMNPLELVARNILPQLYLITGQEEQAQKLIEENQFLIPVSAQQSSILHAQVFIYFMQNQYDKCLNVSKQILMVHPQAPYARFFTIACYNRLNQKENAEAHIKQLFLHNPKFNLKDVEGLMQGIDEQSRVFILDSVQNIFAGR